MSLHGYVGQEVFIVGPDEAIESSGDISIFTEYKDMLSWVEQRSNLIINGTHKIWHGILQEATVLPYSLKRQNAFLVATSGDIWSEAYDETLTLCVGAIFETDAKKGTDLAIEIEELVNEGIEESEIFEKVSIDRVFVLYGYVLYNGHFPSGSFEEDTDEQVVDACKEISNDICNIYSKHQGFIDNQLKSDIEEENSSEEEGALIIK